VIRSCLILVLSLLFLTGCPFTGSREDAAVSYVEALGRGLESDPDFSRIPTVTALPSKRARRLDMPEIEMGLMDFLSLYGCELQLVVGERTSTLGRVAHPGTRLDYHIKFISAAEDCLPKIDSESRAQSLRNAAQAKRDSIPEALWNGIWGASEMERFFSRSGGTLPAEPDPAVFRDASAQVETVLALIGALEPGRIPDELAQLNSVYKHWQARPLAGQVLRSAEALRARLDDATGLLRRHLDQASPCAAGADVYQRLFERQYLGSMSPRLSLIRHDGRRLFDRLHALVHATGADVPDSMTPFIERNLQPGPGSIWYALDQSISGHIKAWNQLLAQCRQG